MLAVLCSLDKSFANYKIVVRVAKVSLGILVVVERAVMSIVWVLGTVEVRQCRNRSQNCCSRVARPFCLVHQAPSKGHEVGHSVGSCHLDKVDQSIVSRDSEVARNPKSIGGWVVEDTVDRCRYHSSIVVEAGHDHPLLHRQIHCYFHMHLQKMVDHILFLDHQFLGVSLVHNLDPPSMAHPLENLARNLSRVLEKVFLYLGQVKVLLGILGHSGCTYCLLYTHSLPLLAQAEHHKGFDLSHWRD